VVCRPSHEGESAAQDFITVVISADDQRKRLARAWTLGADGKPLSRANPKAWLFKFHKQPLRGLDDLGRVLRQIESRPHVGAVRGEAIAPGPKRQRRLLFAKEDAAATICAAAHHWLAFDFDKTPFPPGMDYSDLARLAIYVIETELPECFTARAALSRRPAAPA